MVSRDCSTSPYISPTTRPHAPTLGELISSVQFSSDTRYTRPLRPVHHGSALSPARYTCARYRGFLPGARGARPGRSPGRIRGAAATRRPSRRPSECRAAAEVVEVAASHQTATRLHLALPGQASILQGLVARPRSYRRGPARLAPYQSRHCSGRTCRKWHPSSMIRLTAAHHSDEVSEFCRSHL